MKKLRTHSRTSLFLIELIIAILFLALCSAATIRLFAASYTGRVKARQLNRIQNIITSVGETMEIWSGDPAEFEALFPDGDKKDDSFRFYYDKAFSPCAASDAAYQMTIYPAHNTREKGGLVSFTDASGHALYSQQILYPAALQRGEPDE